MAAECQPEEVEEVGQEIPEDQTDFQPVLEKPSMEAAQPLGWQNANVDDASMQTFLLAILLVIIILRLLAWLFDFGCCFWTCFWACLWQS